MSQDAESKPGPRVELIRPERAADHAIRGYLHQAAVTAKLWLQLRDDEVLVCEGDEDCDKYLLDETRAAFRSVELTQLKAVRDPMSVRSPAVREAIANFAVAFARHSAAGLTPTFVFSTTAARARQQTRDQDPPFDVDLLQAWERLALVDGAERDALVQQLLPRVAALLAEAHGNEALGGARRFLDDEPARWSEFLLAVRWQFGQEGLVDELATLERRLGEQPACQHLPSEHLAGRLVFEVLCTSTKSDVRERTLTRQQLARLLASTKESLQRWAESAGWSRIQDLARRVDALERVVARDAAEALVQRLGERARADLARHATFRVGADELHVERAVVRTIADYARRGSLLVVGPAGIGKSGVLYHVDAELRRAGVDTLLLTADQVADEETVLLDGIERMRGDAPAVLLVDALDSVRDDERSIRLRRVLNGIAKTRGRWNVVASIRTFDLDHSREIREAFSAADSDAPISARHPTVACVEVGALDADELQRVGERLPTLGVLLCAASPELRDLLRVPFHLKLACGLSDAGALPESLALVGTRAQLLDAYWNARVDDRTHGSARQSALHAVCERMVAKNRLVASQVPPLPEPGQVDALLSSGVLVRFTADDGPDDSRVAFSHHVLFDYAVARAWLPPDHDDLVELLERRPELIVFARRSLDLYFERLWARPDATKSRFWSVTLAVTACESLHILAKIVGPGVCARQPVRVENLAPLMDALHTGTPGADEALAHLELAVRGSQSEPRGCWDELARFAAGVERHRPRDSARLIISACLAREHVTSALGEAARALFDSARGRAEPAATWPELIGYVCATAKTNVAATSERIRPLVEPSSLLEHGHRTLMPIARWIRSLEFDPALVREVYVAAFTAPAQADGQTALGDSQILGMAASRRDVYGAALHVLAEAFASFVSTDFEGATWALFEILDVAVSRATEGVTRERLVVSIPSVGDLGLVDDLGELSESGRDADVEPMRRTWLDAAGERIRGPDGSASILKVLAQRGGGSAVVWRTVCELGALAPYEADALACILESSAIYLSVGARDKATEWLAAAFPAWPEERRERVERALLAAYDGFPTLGLDQTLGAIAAHVVTAEARALVAMMNAAGTAPLSEPTVRHRRGGRLIRPADDYLREIGVDPEAEPHASLLAASRSLDPATGSLEAAVRLRAQLEAAGPGVAVQVANEVWAAALDALRHAVEGGLSENSAREALEVATAALDAPAVSARHDALQILGALAQHESIRGEALALVEACSRDGHPTVRWGALAAMEAAAPVAGERLWNVLDERAANECDPTMLRVLANTLLRSAVAADPGRALGRARGLLDRLADLDGCLDARGSVYRVVAHELIERGDIGYREVVSSRAIHGQDSAGDEVLFASRVYLTLPCRAEVAVRERAVEVLRVATTVALEWLDRRESGDDERARRAIERLDICARELQYSISDDRARGGASLSESDLRAFLDLTKGLLRMLASSGIRSVVHHTIKALALLVDVDPVRAYTMIAAAVEAGRAQGYETESFAVELLVEVTARVLSEHRGLVRSEPKLRNAIMEVLGTFVRIGWAPAHALTFELANVWR